MELGIFGSAMRWKLVCISRRRTCNCIN